MLAAAPGHGRPRALEDQRPWSAAGRAWGRPVRRQIYRLAAKVPERLSLRTLAALCDIFDCTPNDLIEVGAASPAPKPDSDVVVELAKLGRPRRARVNPDQR